MDAYKIIIQPWLTEKSMEARSSQSRLEFIVHRSATKNQSQERLKHFSKLKLQRLMFVTQSMGSTHLCVLLKVMTPRTRLCV